MHPLSGHGDAPLLQLEVSATTKKGLARHAQAQARLLHNTALPRVLRQPPLKAGVPAPVRVRVPVPAAICTACEQVQRCGAECTEQERTMGALPGHDNDAATGALSPRLLALARLTTHLRRTTCLSAQG